MLLPLFYTCKKEPGTGGLATIHGKLMGYNVNKYGLKFDSGYYVGVKVYLSFGSNKTVDAEARTGMDGSYEFDWLQKGKYTVWLNANCGCPNDTFIDSKKIEITKSREVVELPDLITYY